MSRHIGKGGNYLQIDQDPATGRIVFTIVLSRGAKTVPVSLALSARSHCHAIVSDVLEIYGQPVPSSLDNSLNAGISSAQEDRFGAALSRAGVNYRRGLSIKTDRFPNGNWQFCYPDFVVADPAWVAVFFDGCYWHKCPKHSPYGRGRPEQDLRITAALSRNGWRVIRIWEHEDFDIAAQRVADVIRARIIQGTPAEPASTVVDTESKD